MMENGVVARAAPNQAASATSIAVLSPRECRGDSCDAVEDVGGVSRQALAGQNEILEMLAAGGPLAEVLDALCLHIESLVTGGLCSILLVDETGQTLGNGRGPSLPLALTEPTSGFAVNANIGVCGRAASHRAPVIVPDATVDPGCAEYCDLLREHHLVACWSVPIIDGAADRLLGTFAVYHRTPRRPSAPELALLEKASYLAGLAIRGWQTDEALRQSEARSRALIQHATDLVTLLDAEDIIRYESHALWRLTGYRPEEVVGRNLDAVVHPDDVSVVKRAVAQVRDDPTRVIMIEVRHRHQAGDYRVFEMTVSNLLDEPSVGRIAINARDITDRKATEIRYRNLVEHLPAITYIDRDDADGTTRPLYVSPRIAEVLGWTPDDCLADPGLWERVIHADDHARVTSEIARAKSSGSPFDAEYRVHGRDERVVWVHDKAVLVEGATGDPPVWQGVRFDVTQQKAAEARLAHLAFHDPLTDLPNRNLLLDRLQQQLNRPDAAIPGILFLDLDGFKEVNDRVGHVVGDELLVAVGQRLRGAVRAGDTAARFGGDEFAVLVPNVAGSDEVRGAGQRFLDALRPPFMIQGHELTVGASLGAALASPALATADEFLRAADVALYRAKAMGRGSLALFDPEVDGPALQRREREAELRRALDRDELRIAYQPVVDLATDRVLAVEALVRWEHPHRGLIPPAAFLPLAEETGLIVPIGYWLIREAWRQLQAWEAQSPQPPVLQLNVNLSARQFRQADLVGQLLEIARASGLPLERLSLEIAEEAVIADPRAATRTIQELKDLGVSVSIDDFGTAFAALGSLKHLVVDDLKIDISRIPTLGRSRGDAAVVRATVGMAKEIGVRVTAEGIETPEQVGFMRGLGVDRAQGFHFAPPLAFSEIAIFMHQQTDSLSPSVE